MMSAAFSRIVPAPAPVLAPAPASASAAAAKPYVLLVDDHEPSLRQLDALIRGAGHRCVAACSGTEALHCCDSRRPRVVVTDLAMPNLDGVGLARWLHARYPSIPLILMTAHELDAQARGALEHTFTAVLPKPIDIQNLLGLLDRLTPRAAPARGGP
jgi:CheY-like chemotaxis protein